MQSHYLDMLVSAEDSARLLGQLLFAVHGANRSRSAGLVVAFPDWQEAVRDSYGKLVRKAAAGTRLRVFGTATALAEFEASTTPKKFIRTGAAVSTGVKAVPAEHARVRFIRDRTSERATEGDRARRVRRREQRGNGRPPARPAPQPESARAPYRDYVKLDLASQETGMRFPLRIARESAPLSGTAAREFSSYGLSVEPGAAVPSF